MTILRKTRRYATHGNKLCSQRYVVPVSLLATVVVLIITAPRGASSAPAVKRSTASFHGVVPGLTTRAQLYALPRWGEPQRIQSSDASFDLFQQYHVRPTNDEWLQLQVRQRLSALANTSKLSAEAYRQWEILQAAHGLNGVELLDYQIAPWTRVSVHVENDIAWAIDAFPAPGVTIDQLEEQFELKQVLRETDLGDTEPPSLGEIGAKDSDVAGLTSSYSVPQCMRVGPMIRPANLRYREYANRRIAIFHETTNGVDTVRFIRFFADAPLRYPMLGVRLKQADDSSKKYDGLDRQTVVTIISVTPKSVGENAGFEVGDVILSLNGRRITDLREFRKELLACRLDSPSEFVVWRNGRSLILKGAPKPESLASAYLRRGNYLIRQREFAAGIDDLNTLVQLSPDKFHALSVRGDAHRLAGDNQAAVEDLSESIKLNPKYPTAYLVRGMAWENLESPDLALADYDEAIRLAPRFLVAYERRAALYRKLGRDGDAAADTAYVKSIKDEASAVDKEQAASPLGGDADLEPQLKTRTIGKKTLAYRRQEGGSLKLDDGFTLTLPAGALKGDTNIEVEHLVADKDANGLVDEVEFYRVKVQGASTQLDQPARIRLPFDPQNPPLETESEKIVVAHATPSGRIEYLDVNPDPRGFVEVETTSVATDWWRPWNNPYVKLADEAINDTRTKRLIRAPYYSQGDAEWCWATCAAMLLGTYGHAVQPHQVAEVFGKTKSQGASLWPIIGTDLDDISAKLKLPSVPITQHALGTLTEKNLRGWLIHQLRNGRPVWVGLPHYKGFSFPGRSDHAILVVGYDHVGFYVHDPSGALIKELLIRRKRNPRSDPKVDDEKLALFHVRYDEWQHTLYPSFFQYRPWSVSSAFVDADGGQSQKTITIQLVSRDHATVSGEGGIHFARDEIVFADQKDVYYYWNGLAPGGGGFSPTAVDDAKVGIEGLCNSDRLKSFYVLLHNTSDTDFHGRVILKLNGTPIGVSVDAKVPAETTNRPIELTSKASPTETQAPRVITRPYVNIEARSRLSLREAFDFIQHPLVQDTYSLEVEVLSENQVLDRDSVVFPARAAIVPPPKAEKVPRADGRPVHRITWRPSREETRVGRERIRYSVHRIVMEGDGIASRGYLESPIQRREDGTYATEYVLVEHPKLSKLEFLYRVIAIVDERLEFASPMSQPTIPLDGSPEKLDTPVGTDKLVGKWWSIGGRMQFQKYIAQGQRMYVYDRRKQREVLGFDPGPLPFLVIVKTEGGYRATESDGTVWSLKPTGESDGNPTYEAIQADRRVRLILKADSSSFSFGESFYLPDGKVTYIE